jgi:hypothetical protein
MSTTLSRKFRVDVTADLTLASGWAQLNGIDDWNATITPNTEETTAYDTNGWKSNEVTLQDWSATASLFRRIVSGTYDPGQELVRATQGLFGNSARVGVRWYDKNGGTEAYQGIAIPTISRSNTGVSNVEKWSIAFMATDVALATISNPGVAAAAAILVGATPSGQAAGASVVITGSGFTGTTGSTGVKFGGTNATSYIVANDSVISAVLPAGSAGSAPIIVTNPVGASAPLAYTRA